MRAAVKGVRTGVRTAAAVGGSAVAGARHRMRGTLGGPHRQASPTAIFTAGDDGERTLFNCTDKERVPARERTPEQDRRSAAVMESAAFSTLQRLLVDLLEHELSQPKSMQLVSA